MIIVSMSFRVALTPALCNTRLAASYSEPLGRLRVIRTRAVVVGVRLVFPFV